MNIEEARIGTKLEIEAINSLGARVGQIFISQIIDIVDKKNLVIAAPIHESRIAFIPLGAKIRAIFLHHKYGLLSFIGIVSKKEKRESLLELGITVESSLEKIQRRNYFRLDCVLDAQYCIKTPDEEENPVEGEKPPIVYIKAITKNISGCGACIVTDSDIEKNQLIELILQLETGLSIKALCKIVRVTAMDSPKGRKYEYGLYFNKISQKDQDIMIKYIFDQQKKLLKRGL